MNKPTKFDAVIIGGGHNGLVAACYLAQAGLRTLILEKNEAMGGATLSKKLFPGNDVNVSVYSDLVSLLPQKILNDLGLRLEIHQKAIASYTPVMKAGKAGGLLISNVSEESARQSFIHLYGHDLEYANYRDWH